MHTTVIIYRGQNLFFIRLLTDPVVPFSVLRCPFVCLSFARNHQKQGSIRMTFRSKTNYFFRGKGIKA